MHILSINNENENNILRSSSRLITDEDFSTGYVSKVTQQLKDSLLFYGNGVWLSAIQIGYAVQIFMIDCKPTQAFPSMQEFSQVIINPIITHYSEETFDGREWCMSIANEQCIPAYRYQVRRSKKITFDYTDEHNIRHTDTTLSGITAVIFQHEYDHLFGRLIDQTGLSGQIISNDEYQERRKNGEEMTII